MDMRASRVVGFLIALAAAALMVLGLVGTSAGLVLGTVGILVIATSHDGRDESA